MYNINTLKILALLLFSLTFFSCSDDDDDDGSASNNTSGVTMTANFSGDLDFDFKGTFQNTFINLPQVKQMVLAGHHVKGTTTHTITVTVSTVAKTTFIAFQSTSASNPTTPKIYIISDLVTNYTDNDDKVEGTFSFTATVGAESFTCKNGKFIGDKSKLK